MPDIPTVYRKLTGRAIVSTFNKKRHGYVDMLLSSNIGNTYKFNLLHHQNHHHHHHHHHHYYYYHHHHQHHHHQHHQQPKQQQQQLNTGNQN